MLRLSSRDAEHLGVRYGALRKREGIIEVSVAHTKKARVKRGPSSVHTCATLRRHFYAEPILQLQSPEAPEPWVREEQRSPPC